MGMAYEDDLRKRREDPRRNAYGRDYYQKNRDYFREYQKEYKKSGRRKPGGWGNYKADTHESRCWAVAAGMCGSSRARSRREKWPFGLSTEWIARRIRAGKCELTGVPFVLERKSPYMPSLDRIDSSKFYTADNCRVILLILNLAKRDWPEDVFQAAFLAAADGLRGSLPGSGAPPPPGSP
jgi:hypothetical protein